MLTTKTSSNWLNSSTSIYRKGAANFPIFTKESTFNDFIQNLFSDGSVGVYFDIQRTASQDNLGYLLDSSTGLYGSDIKSTGEAVVVGSADISQYDVETGVGQVYRADLYNQGIVNFTTTTTQIYELDIENTGTNSISVKAELAMGSVIFNVTSGMRIKKVIEGNSVVAITATNDVNTSNFKVHSFKTIKGNTAKQPNSAKRPSIVTNASGYKALKFDGFDDFYQTANIDFSKTDKVTVICAMRKLSDAAAGVVFELGSDTATINGTFGLYAPRFNGQDRISFASRGSATALSNIATVPSPISGVVTAKAQISTDLNTISFNGGQKTNSSSTSQGTGNYSNNQIFVGMRGGTSFPFNGESYALLIIGKLLTTEETTKVEKEFSKYLGISI